MFGSISLTIVLAVLAPAPAPDAPPAAPDVVVASVGAEPIYASEVERIVHEAGRGQEVHPAVLPVLRAQALSEIIDRRLVLAYAKRNKSGPSEAEIASAVAASTADRPDDDKRRQVAWSLTWRMYLAKYVTPERLAAYFETHRRDFDGTEVSVSHVLLRPEPDDAAAAVDQLVARANAIREEILSGKTSFAEAARKHSAGPSSEDGGDLGFIGRRGPMVESFSQAAFALEVGQVSEPVTTPFGVHLIRCNEVKPGSKRVPEVREQLEEALARELLKKLARYEREHTPVEFTGAMPYFKPGTRELVVP